MEPTAKMLRAAQRAGITAMPGESDEALRDRVLDVLGHWAARMPLTARDVDAIVGACLPARGVSFTVGEMPERRLLIELHARWWKRLFYSREARAADAVSVERQLLKRVEIGVLVEVTWA